MIFYKNYYIYYLYIYLYISFGFQKRRTFSLASTTLPKEIFWHILRFWRSKRDGMYGVNPFDLHPDPNDFTGPSLYYESEEALSYES